MLPSLSNDFLPKIMPGILGVTDFWMARWLTPVWFLGIGVIFGLLALGAFLGLCYLLSKIPLLDTLRSTGVVHAVAGIATLVSTVLASRFISGAFYERGTREFLRDEFILFALALGLLFGVFWWAVFYCSNRRFMLELKSLISDGVGFYMLCVLSFLSIVGLASSFLVESPRDAFSSLSFYVDSLLNANPGTKEESFVIPGIVSEAEAKFVSIPLKYDSKNLLGIQLMSDKNLLIGDGPSIADFRVPGFQVENGVEFSWDRSMGAEKCPLPLSQAAEVWVQNQEIGDAKLNVVLSSSPAVPQSGTFLLAGLFVLLFGLLFFLMQAIAPKASAIALATAKSELSQPLPLFLMVLVGIAILLFVFLPFITFGEDIKFLKENGITLILVACTFQAVWSASTSVNEEIEGRTALTLLSKPVHRRSFIVGKMLGVFWIVLFMFMVLGSIELLAVAYTPIYDARESSLEQPDWRQCHFEMMQTIPGLAMAFFQAVVIGAISVALGTRLSFVANFAICFAIYMLGHLTPTIVASAEGGLPLVEFFSQLISAAVPNLSLFSMEAAIDSDIQVPWSILASVLLYTVMYFLMATLLGLLLFEDRDLA
jgi:ABC-type transport system involved in multi-copper enzyme maturation permease subunit